MESPTGTDLGKGYYFIITLIGSTSCEIELLIERI
jgi:hypothetical protein